MLYVISSYFFPYRIIVRCSRITISNSWMHQWWHVQFSVRCDWTRFLKSHKTIKGSIQQLNQTSTRSRIEPFLFPLEIMKNLHLLSLSLLFVYKRIYMQHKTTARLDRCFENWNLLKHLERTCTTFILIFSCMCDTKKKPMRNRKGKLTIHSWNAEW